MYLISLTAAYFSRVGGFSIDSWFDRDDCTEYLAKILTVMVTGQSDGVNVCLLTMQYRDSTLDKYLPPLRSIVVRICLLEFSQIVMPYALIIIQSYWVSTMLK